MAKKKAKTKNPKDKKLGLMLLYISCALLPRCCKL